eukprot:TRINITY_DN5303_c0_g1_i1.p1 TRINITY_DN5303_c0_g1~~TRINITY_DN5303_c0_g1_i1.p1  ORF type:complete len:163 (-),score=32.12 TRINITY_DN5303_c0_g1_i1:60-548(-)
MEGEETVAGIEGTIEELDSLSYHEIRQWFNEFADGDYRDDDFITELEHQQISGRKLRKIDLDTCKKYLGDISGGAFWNELNSKESSSSTPSAPGLFIRAILPLAVFVVTSGTNTITAWAATTGLVGTLVTPFAVGVFNGVLTVLAQEIAYRRQFQKITPKKP